MKIICISIFSILFCSSCSVLEQKSKQQLSSGIYKSTTFDDKKKSVYIDNKEETVVIYPINKDEKGNLIIDTLHHKKQIYLEQYNSDHIKSSVFLKNSFDVDFLTIPFKYRPAQKDLPNQFTTNLNGEVYFGYRTDAYSLDYKLNPFQKFNRNINHYAFSFGLFTGFGGTAMNPSVTQEKIMKEYDGVVWSKGIAGIIGVNNFTIGIAIGYDNLLDQNKQYWIYQNKLWYGLAFGLNLN